MPRTARKRSESGIYHVLLRGINKQLIFEEPADYEQFIGILSEIKDISGLKLFAYCMMSNHVHILLKEGKEPVSQIMKRIGARYVFWFNWKYQRNGHLFQDRFLSEPVDSNAYFITVLAYIYQNPVKAGISEKTTDYQWSSRRLLGKSSIIDEAELADIVSVKEIQALDGQVFSEAILEPKIGRRQQMTDEVAFEKMKELGSIKTVAEFQSLDREVQAEVFVQLSHQGASIRQLSRLSGLSKGVVDRLKGQQQAN